MSEESVLVRTSPEGVATVTLNRLELHNAPLNAPIEPTPFGVFRM